jgi:hypothetical protein
VSAYLQSAFDAVCKDAKRPEGFYVCLMEKQQVYGGPEEGGWWRTNRVLVAYQHFDTEEQANAAADAVRKLAEELKQQSRREHGKQCLREMDWLHARRLDADFLPEPDGPNEYYVEVGDSLPSNYYDSAVYE